MKHLDDVRLQDLAGGAASAADESAHLAACETCRAEVEAYRALREVLASLRPASPPGFTSAVMARIDARRQTLRRQLAVAFVAPVAGLAVFAAAFREAAVLSIAEGTSGVTSALGLVTRVATKATAS